MVKKQRILAIVGPTASGKTSLSIELAKKFNGEVISADSRQVYRGLNLGTGKVTKEEMLGVPHHLIDVADPKDTYTVADFVRDGRSAISDIIDRSKLPIVVGGTFFYVDALLGKVVAPSVLPNAELRNKLEAIDTEKLFHMLTEKDARRAEDIDKHNRRRLIRALEIVDAIGAVPPTAHEELYDVLTLGIMLTKVELHENIHKRLIERIDAGMIAEVEQLHTNGLSYERMEDLGLEYRYIARYLQATISYETMLSELETKIRQFAKRQMTWLKRDKVKKVNVADREAGLGHAESREGSLGYAPVVWVDKNEMEKIEDEIKKFLRE
jgi:tRNA dimethylallyltransferase